jgi:hypothetical protein
MQEVETGTMLRSGGQGELSAMNGTKVERAGSRHATEADGKGLKEKERERGGLTGRWLEGFWRGRN